MIEVAAVLVIGDEYGGLAPERAVHDGLDDLAQKRLPECDVLGVLL